MKKLLPIVACVCAVLGCGCGAGNNSAGQKAAGSDETKSDDAAVVGNYVYKSTADVKKELEQDRDALEATEAKARAGDDAARKIVATMPKDAPTEERLMEGTKLSLTKDKNFTFTIPDRTTGKILETSGTYTVDSGTKLTLSVTKINGKKAEGPDAKTISMTFDKKERTITGDTGGGPKLVMQMR